MSMKRILAVFLALILCVEMLPPVKVAADPADENPDLKVYLDQERQKIDGFILSGAFRQADHLLNGFADRPDKQKEVLDLVFGTHKGTDPQTNTPVDQNAKGIGISIWRNMVGDEAGGAGSTALGTTGTGANAKDLKGLGYYRWATYGRWFDGAVATFKTGAGNSEKLDGNNYRWWFDAAEASRDSSNNAWDYSSLATARKQTDNATVYVNNTPYSGWQVREGGPNGNSAFNAFDWPAPKAGADLDVVGRDAPEDPTADGLAPVDRGQVWAMKWADKYAKARGEDMKFISAAWSAPAWLKTNNITYGRNVPTANWAAYATYLADYVEGYKDIYGLPIYGISLSNEPNAQTNANSDHSYSGSYWSTADYERFTRQYLIPEFESRGLLGDGKTGTKLQLGDEMNWNPRYLTPFWAATGAKNQEWEQEWGSFTDYITHSYSASPTNGVNATSSDLLEMLLRAQMDGNSIWNSEISTMSSQNFQSAYNYATNQVRSQNGANSRSDMGSALGWASMWNRELSVAQKNGVGQWWAWGGKRPESTWPGTPFDNSLEDLIYIVNNASGTNGTAAGGIQGSDTGNYTYDYRVHKVFWALGHYSKFVRPDWHRVNVEQDAIVTGTTTGQNPTANYLNVSSSSFVSPTANDDGTYDFSVVVLNGTTADQTLDISFPGYEVESLTRWETREDVTTNGGVPTASNNTPTYSGTTEGNNMVNKGPVASWNNETNPAVTVPFVSITTFVGKAKPSASYGKDATQTIPAYNYNKLEGTALFNNSATMTDPRVDLQRAPNATASGFSTTGAHATLTYNNLDMGYGAEELIINIGGTNSTSGSFVNVDSGQLPIKVYIDGELAANTTIASSTTATNRTVDLVDDKVFSGINDVVIELGSATNATRTRINSIKFNTASEPPVGAKSVEVNPQSDSVSAGVAGTVSFPVETANIADGEYTVTVANLPNGVSVQGDVTIANNAGTLVLAVSAEAVQGDTENLKLTIDGVTSEDFTISISELEIASNWKRADLSALEAGKKYVIVSTATGAALTNKTSTGVIAGDGIPTGDAASSGLQSTPVTIDADTTITSKVTEDMIWTLGAATTSHGTGTDSYGHFTLTNASPTSGDLSGNLPLTFGSINTAGSDLNGRRTAPLSTALTQSDAALTEWCIYRPAEPSVVAMVMYDHTNSADYALALQGGDNGFGAVGIEAPSDAQLKTLVDDGALWLFELEETPEVLYEGNINYSSAVVNGKNVGGANEITLNIDSSVAVTGARIRVEAVRYIPGYNSTAMPNATNQTGGTTLITNEIGNYFDHYSAKPYLAADVALDLTQGTDDYTVRLGQVLDNTLATKIEVILPGDSEATVTLNGTPAVSKNVPGIDYATLITTTPSAANTANNLPGAVVPASIKAAADDSEFSLAEKYKDYFSIGNVDRGAASSWAKKHFNVFTAENSMKPSSLMNSSGIINFAATNTFINNAIANDSEVVGHVLLWHGQSQNNHQPGPNATREQSLERMESYIKTVVENFDERVYPSTSSKAGEKVLRGWDVVNEAFINEIPYVSDTDLNTPGSWKKYLRNSNQEVAGWENAPGSGSGHLGGMANRYHWYDGFANGADTAAGESGADFIYWGFVFARRYSDAELNYNDFNIYEEGKAQMVAQMVTELNARYAAEQPNAGYLGGPDSRPLIEVVGMQGHWYIQDVPARDPQRGLQRALEILREADVRVHITELDLFAFYPNPGSGNNTVMKNRTGANAENSQGEPYWRRRFGLPTDQNISEAGFGKYMEAVQAEVYAEYFAVFMENADIIDRVTFWGLQDTSSWRQYMAPLPWYADLSGAPNPKLSYYAIADPVGFMGLDNIAAPETSVRRVRMNPYKPQTAERGDTQNFAATVIGNGNPANTVTWTVEGKHSADTQITSDGVLTIGADETSTKLIVKATSTDDTSVLGETVVTVDGIDPLETMEYYQKAAQAAADEATQAAEEAKEAAQAAKEAQEAAEADAEAAAEAAEAAADAAAEAAAEAVKAKEEAEAAAEAAEAAAEAAGESETAKLAAEVAKAAAETAQGKAETAQGKAEDAQTAAETAQGKAEAAQGKAEDAKAAAEEAQGKAEDAQVAAEEAQEAAELAKTGAVEAQGLAEAARDEAVAAKEAAETAKGTAEAAAQAAAAEKALAEAAVLAAKAAVTEAEAAVTEAKEAAARAEEAKSLAQAAVLEAKGHAEAAESARLAAEKAKADAEKAAAEAAQKTALAEEGKAAAEKAQKEAEDALKVANSALKVAQDNQKEAADALKVANNALKAAQNAQKDTNALALAQRKVTIKSAKNSKKGQIKVTFKKDSAAVKYQVQYSLKKNFKGKTVAKGKPVTKTTDKTTYTIKKLKKKTYYVRVRAYTTDSRGKKVYGKWSTVKTVKVKK